MNKEILQGDWKLVKGKIKEKWGKLTDDDLTQINGKREQLLGIIQKKYGIAKERAETELSTWEKQCGCGSSSSDAKCANKEAAAPSRHSSKH